MLHRFVLWTRYLFLLPVVASFAAAAIAVVYGVLDLWHSADQALAAEVSSTQAKALALGVIEAADLFLLGTVLYILGLGLYELFIDENVPLPHWLEIHNEDDLKNKLVGVLIVVMGVAFLGQVISWDGQRELLGYGAGTGAVIVALTYLLSIKLQKKNTP